MIEATPWVSAHWVSGTAFLDCVYRKINGVSYIKGEFNTNGSVVSRGAVFTFSEILPVGFRPEDNSSLLPTVDTNSIIMAFRLTYVNGDEPYYYLQLKFLPDGSIRILNLGGAFQPNTSYIFSGSYSVGN